MLYDLNFRKSVDKFYTNPSIIQNILSNIFAEAYLNYTFVEPSAGNGALVDVMKNLGISNIQAYDLYPERKDIRKQDFLKLDIRKLLKTNNTITFQNPPFGSNCNLAIKFFNKSALFSSEIWQIVPRTFKKQSIQDKLNKFFHLTYEIDMPKNSFVLDGEIYDVPCCFQIWKKQNSERVQLVQNLTSAYFDFVDKSEATHAVRRVGGRSGKLLEGLDYKDSSTYFLKILDSRVIDILRTADFSKIVNSTAGVRSLSKKELIQYIESKI